MSFSYLFDPNKQFQDRNGVNNVGGFLRVYIDGTDDRATTYKDFNGTLNEADIMLDTDGRAVVIVDDSFTFRIEVYERGGALQWTVTQFTARGEGGGGESSTPVVVDGTANEIDVTESMTAGVKYYTIGLATVVKNTLLGLLASFSNLVGILNSKADKVQGATAGNIAALDASGNLTDSGSKVADFKTKQTPVADPIASGAGLEFIDSVSQNANGEITPHKKSVQDGTTAQKGVVKLSNAIDSTSVTEAATPKAVKDAYDELNNKIVARAVFLSQAEWAVQSQLPGDPAKVYYVENGTGEDAYTVYVWKESTSTYEEVDESSIDLDGYWHDGPTTTGNGNVVTNITLGNDGVPQVEKGMSAEPAFSVLPVNKGGTGKTTGKAATNNLFSDINNVNTDPDDTARIVFKYESPSDSNGIFFARPITNLWNYIQNKISSVLGLTASSYGGNAATATTATNYASGGGIANAINAKQDAISDLATIRSGATAGASALQPSGNGSNVSVTPDGTSTGYDLGSSTTLKAFAQKFKNLVSALKALAFKDKASYNDLSSGVQSSLDKADSALQSHQSVTDNNPTLAWGATSTVGTVGSTNLRVTMPTNPASGKADKANITGATKCKITYNGQGIVTSGADLDASDIPNLLASKITSGTFDAARIPTSLPDVTAGAASAAASGSALATAIDGKQTNYLKCFRIENAGSGYAKICRINVFKDSIWGDEMGCTFAIQCMYFSYEGNYRSVIGLMNIQFSARSYENVVAKMIVTQSQQILSSMTQSLEFIVSKVDNYNFDLFVRFLVPAGTKALNINLIDGCVGIRYENSLVLTNTAPSPAVNVQFVLMPFVESDGVGSTTTPVYVDSDGQVRLCTPSQMGVGAASYAEKAKEGCKGSNTATLYIAGTFGDANLPYYHVKDVKNGCINYVHVKDIPYNTCSITIEAPTLASGEEYDYVVVFDTFTNSNLIGSIDVENCKTAGRMDNGVFVVDSMALMSANPQYVPMIVVTGNVASSKWYNRT